MSSSPSSEPGSALSELGSFDRVSESVLPPVRLLAFWAAVALPFLYLPLLLTPLESTAMRAAFITLLLCNAVALLVGHPHMRD